MYVLGIPRSNRLDLPTSLSKFFLQIKLNVDKVKGKDYTIFDEKFLFHHRNKKKNNASIINTC